MNKLSLPILVFTALAINMSAIAQGDLLITPVRVIFEDSKQVQELNLVNTGIDTATFTVSFLQFRMTETGNLVQVKKDSAGMYADEFLRVFPRRIVLAPGEPQVIMLQLRRKGVMKDGEYRSHLYFRAEKDDKNLKSGSADPNTIGINIIPVFGITIPVIVRTGHTNTDVSLNNLHIENTGHQDLLKMTINRTGNISTYGDIVVKYVPSSGKPTELGKLHGVGVYTDTEKRNVSIKLKYPEGIDLRNGKIEVTYTGEKNSQKFNYAQSEIKSGF